MGATLTNDDLGCNASALITAGDGRTYPIDAQDAEAEVPGEGSAAWRGSLAIPTHDHSGEVRLAVGPLWDVQLGAWGPSPNAANESQAEGTLALPSFMQEVPAGRYKLTGFHQGAEGGCAGEVVVEIAETPFSNIAGVSGLAGTGLFAALLVLAAVSRKRG